MNKRYRSYIITFLWSLLFVSTQAVKAQNNQTVASKGHAFVFDSEGKDLFAFLSREVRFPITVAAKTDSCKYLIHGLCTRFDVNKNGTVSNIVFSENVHPDLQTEMKRVLNLTNAHWKAVGTRAKQTMILPVIFQRDDCMERTLDGMSGAMYQQTLTDIFTFLNKQSELTKGKTVILPICFIKGYWKPEKFLRDK